MGNLFFDIFSLFIKFTHIFFLQFIYIILLYLQLLFNQKIMQIILELCWEDFILFIEGTLFFLTNLRLFICQVIFMNISKYFEPSVNFFHIRRANVCNLSQFYICVTFQQKYGALRMKQREISALVRDIHHLVDSSMISAFHL